MWHTLDTIGAMLLLIFFGGGIIYDLKYRRYPPTKPSEPSSASQPEESATLAYGHELDTEPDTHISAVELSSWLDPEND